MEGSLFCLLSSVFCLLELTVAELTPRQIVQELNRYIVGQDAARRRWPSPSATAAPPAAPARPTQGRDTQEHHHDRPHGVGKTEDCPPAAQLIGAPFLKVEATKYTEVGYHGRDVESMVRDLTEIAIGLIRQEQRGLVENAGRRSASRNACSTCCCRTPARGSPTNPRRMNASSAPATR